MGRVKDYFFSPTKCVICEGIFIPSQVSHIMSDISKPTCCKQCDQEYQHLMEEIHKYQQSMIEKDRVS